MENYKNIIKINVKIFMSLFLIFAVSGCTGAIKSGSVASTVATFVPSFWDDNQSSKIIDVALEVDKLDCSQPHAPQALKIKNNLRWFELYSKHKGFLQKDVLDLVAPMQKTVNDFYNRSIKKQGSVRYCEHKKQILTRQVTEAAEAVMWRF